MPPKGPISLSIQNKNISTSTYRTLQIGVCPEHRPTNKILTLAPPCALAMIILLYYTFLSSSDWRRGHGRKSSSNSLNSTSLRVPMSASVASIPQQFQQLNPLPQIGAGPHLETWEDLLAVNPRTDKKTRLKTYVSHCYDHRVAL